jgi:diguanylate cyclase (GGDEF)-like protein
VTRIAPDCDKIRRPTSFEIPLRADRALRAVLAWTLLLGVPALLALQGVEAWRGAGPHWGLLAVDCLTALGFLAVALLALAQGTSDLRVRLLSGFSAAAALEMALPIDVTGTARVAAVAAYYLLTGAQIGLELHLASLIPDRPDWLRRRPWIVPLYHALGLGLGAVSCATYLAGKVLGQQPFPWPLPWTIDDVDQALRQAGLPLWALAVTLLLASQALRCPEPRGRQQAGLVLAATIPWLLYVVVTTLIERSGSALPSWATALEGLILLGYPVAFFAAIFRYHLFDIELVVRRGLIYTTLTGALVLVFYAAQGAGGAVFSHRMAGRGSAWSVAAATLLLGLLFAPLRRALQRLIDQRFFPERQALRQRLIALAGELPALGKRPRMGQHLVERLTVIFQSRSAALLVASPETGTLSVLAATPGGVDPGLVVAMDDPVLETLRRARRPLPPAQLARRSPAFARSGLDPQGLALPLTSQERLIGVLAVGRQEGGRPYPAEELDLLSLLAHHVATVFENARLFESATYEGLTGLLRREAILEQLDRELARALRYDRPLTIAMADLDHFKTINDRHGHLAGDALLRRVAQVVAEGLRGTDWIGRYGGEEFLLVLPETDMAGGVAVAEKVRSLVQGTWVETEDGGSFHATLSIGLASLAGRLTGRDLIAAADRSLYAAKDGGRNQVYPRVA